MLRTMLMSKLHRATVTGVELGYQGSLSIDAALMKAADILEHEQILVANLRNGARFTTYAITAPKGSKIIQVNGAAAHLCKKGDRLIIMRFAQCTEKEAKRVKPIVLVLDLKNKVDNKTKK